MSDDEASQRSISLSSRRHSFASEDAYAGVALTTESPDPIPTYPPRTLSADRQSVLSTASSLGRKTRPESLLVTAPSTRLILGIALVDFNHLVGPRIEYSKGDIFEDDEIQKILPFLALPDGAHLSRRDYTYFHLVPSRGSSTLFGISCNQQIPASQLLVKSKDVTRSTVQKSVVVLATKPIFGPIRDKLGVVTSALFQQFDFSKTQILDDFEAGLEASVRGQMTESGLHMGTSLRQLVYTFRQRTLLLVKALILQKRIMFYGHPVERLCTYQYSLVSLIPGLLHALEDSASPTLSNRATQLFMAGKPTSLKTSERKSMLRYLGMPLEVFGKDAFFQPYLPLQQLDLLKESRSYLCGTTNSIVTQQREIDLLVNTESGLFEFRDPKLERLVSLTPADRKWMEEIVRDVAETYDPDALDDGGRRITFKGSDDYLRTKFEEYISAALASVKYRDFLARGEGNGTGILIGGATSDSANATDDFNPLWIADFKQSNAYEVWERVTDDMLFDIVEPRHPCTDKPSVVSDISLRLQEGIQDLKLDQQLAPAREAVARTFTAGSANFFKAVEGVRERWQQSKPNSDDKLSGSSTPVEISKADVVGEAEQSPPVSRPFLLTRHSSVDSNASQGSAGATATATASTAAAAAATQLGTWGAGIGSFLSSRAARFSLPKATTLSPSPASTTFFSPSSSGTPTTAAHTPSPAVPGSRSRSSVSSSSRSSSSYEGFGTSMNGIGIGDGNPRLNGNGNGVGIGEKATTVPVPPLKSFNLQPSKLSPISREEHREESESEPESVGETGTLAERLDEVREEAEEEDKHREESRDDHNGGVVMVGFAR